MNVINDEHVPSQELLEAAPALKIIRIEPCNKPHAKLGATVFQPVIAALHRGIGLRNLRQVCLSICLMGDVLFRVFLGALDDSGCAERMEDLSFYDCGIGFEGANALADLLRRDLFPALESISLSENEIRDEGVVALAKGLCEAPRTSLKELKLDDVGMGDVGLAALASVVTQGRMRRMHKFMLHKALDVTDEGIILFVRAIEAYGLPHLEEFKILMLHKEKVTALGFGAITHALGDEHFCNFLEALRDSNCARKMVALSFSYCQLGVGGARILADLPSRDELSALEKLCFSGNNIQDEGVVALAGALREAPQNGLEELRLAGVDMSDVGMGAVASLIRRGRMGRMLKLDLSEIYEATDEGIIDLARAIHERGLPELQALSLELLENLTALGFSAMMHAFVKGCPKASEIHIECPDEEQNFAIFESMVNGMLRAAGRTVVWFTSTKIEICGRT